MNKSMIHSMLFGIAVTAVAMPLQAQMMADPPAPSRETAETVAKVQTDGGVIMISSDGGEYLTADPEQRVKSTARLMVSKESSATVVYDDGCEQKYDQPGIYEISENCVLPVAAVGGGPSKALIVGGILLGGAALYAIIDDYNDRDRPPVSR